MNLDNLECTYPKSQETTPHQITEQDLMVKVFKVRSKTPKVSQILGSVYFEKQSNRRFIPLPLAGDSRFEAINHFPRISTKSSYLPSFNFAKCTSRKEASGNCSPGPCQYNDAASKSSKILHGFDMKKATGRKDTGGFSYDTVDPDKVVQAVKMMQPNNAAFVPDFRKVTDRNSKSPENRRRINEFDRGDYST